MHMLRLVLGLLLHGAALGQGILWISEGRYLLGVTVSVVVLAMLVVIRGVTRRVDTDKRAVRSRVA